MKTRDDEELMRYLDGEMTREEARAVEKRIKGSADEQKKVEALGQLGDVVRARYQAATDEAGPKLDALWAKLETKLDAPAAAPAVKEEARGFFGAIRDWLEGYRGYVVTGAACAAAGALILSLARAPQVKVIKETVYVPQVPDNVETVAAMRSVEFESIEAAEGTPDVVVVPGTKEGDPGTVILVNVEGLTAI